MSVLWTIFWLLIGAAIGFFVAAFLFIDGGDDP